VGEDETETKNLNLPQARGKAKYATKNESVRTRLESSDARRTALPRSLLKNYFTL
jgi:hypothetical protein